LRSIWNHNERKPMPSTTRTASDDVQDQILDTIRKGQEAVVDALRGWTEAAGQLVPKTAPWPGADRFPTPAELVDSYYDFTGELLQAQRDFFHKALEVTAPLREQVEVETTKAARAAKN
jgi:hypothetical protein